ncbi:MAG: hypothetical protein REI64_04450 [Pedobacter sp.]|uniref:hypothetical protein n=1 Tax=Pedobacter sp. TaxID=1411316 RepID=UPI002807EC63|nr:hypothetical protein [Pedobacter sp.]MDQ8004029.1 hypothetical protein [Pedobacter sp.]
MKEQLVEDIKTTLSKSKVELLAQIAAKQANAVKDIIDLTFHIDEKIAFRAAWILENVYTNNPQNFVPFVSYFLDNFHRQNNLSARRHYGKILALLTKKTAPSEIKAILENYNTDQLVETTFAWLIDEEVPVAVKSHCLNILANFCQKHPWIKDELTQTMDYLVDKESVAFFGKVKQIRKQLKSR